MSITDTASGIVGFACMLAFIAWEPFRVVWANLFFGLAAGGLIAFALAWAIHAQFRRKPNAE